jgi:hypothetical protein
MNDVKHISQQSIQDQHSQFVDNFPESADLVISHHLPNAEAFSVPEHSTDSYAPFYHGALSKDLIARTRYWVSGHQHHLAEKIIANKTTYICNPLATPLQRKQSVKAFRL